MSTSGEDCRREYEQITNSSTPSGSLLNFQSCRDLLIPSSFYSLLRPSFSMYPRPLFFFVHSRLQLICDLPTPSSTMGIHVHSAVSDLLSVTEGCRWIIHCRAMEQGLQYNREMVVKRHGPQR